MVQIISRGNSDDMTIKRFKCSHCGCIFTTSVYSKEFSIIEAPNSESKSNCPKCFSQCEEFIEDF